jgi:RNA polymerase sigma factor (sigma-70 family)
VRLPPTTDSEDHRVAVLHAVWGEFHGYVRHLLGGEQHLVEDFMQEAAADFTQYWRANGEVTCDQAAAILKQAAKFDVINYRNSKPRRTTSPVAIDDELLLAYADPHSDQEILAVLGHIDHHRLIQQLPRLLTERQRQIIVAVDIEGLTQAKAAKQLGMSVRGLQMARDTALARLRHYLTTTPVTEHTPSTSREVSP